MSFVSSELIVCLVSTNTVVCVSGMAKVRYSDRIFWQLLSDRELETTTSYSQDTGKVRTYVNLQTVSLTKTRQASFSFKRSLKSIFRIHNETVNIWSHGLGFLGYSLIPLAISSMIDWQSTFSNPSDGFALGVFFASVTVCFIFSTWYVCGIEYEVTILIV